MMSTTRSIEVRKRLTLRYRRCRRPLVPQDIKTDGTIGIDVGVIYLGRETDLRRFEGIVGRERDGKEEDATGVRRISLRVIDN